MNNKKYNIASEEIIYTNTPDTSVQHVWNTMYSIKENH